MTTGFYSLNIGPRLLDPHTLEYPFLLAGHIYNYSYFRSRCSISPPFEILRF